MKMSSDDSIGKLSVSEVTYVCKWEISNYSQLCTDPKNISHSPVFTKGDLQWRLIMRPQSLTENTGRASVCLLLCTESQIEIETAVSFLSRSGAKFLHNEGPKVLFNAKDARTIDLLTFTLSNILQNRKELLLNDKLTILCELTTYVHDEFLGRVNARHERNRRSIPVEIIDITLSQPLDSQKRPHSHKNVDTTQDGNKRPRLVEINDQELEELPKPSDPKFEKFLNNEKFSDVKLIFGSKVIYAHKNILAASSGFFSEMFDQGARENHQNLVEIKDIDSEVFEEMLLFIYTGKVNKMKDFVKDLVVAAEKYAVNDLKVLCEQFLCNNLTLANAIEYLVYAERHKIDELTDKTSEFIVSNAKDLANSSEFQLMKDLNPKLAFEIFRRIALQQGNK